MHGGEYTLPGEPVRVRNPPCSPELQGLSLSLPLSPSLTMAVLSSDTLPLQGPITAVHSYEALSLSLLIKLILEGDFLQLCAINLLLLPSFTVEDLLTASSLGGRQKTKVSS